MAEMQTKLKQHNIIKQLRPNWTAERQIYNFVCQIGRKKKKFNYKQ